MPRFERKSQYDPRPQRRPVTRISTAQRKIDDPAEIRLHMPVLHLRNSTLHPNLFRKRLHEIPNNVFGGDLVAVDLEDGSRLGYGLYNPMAEIAVRMLTFGDIFPDIDFWRARLQRAVSLRMNELKLPETADTYRLIHAEGDGFPGLVIDRYADVLAVEVFALGMFQRAEAAVKLLAELCGTKHYIIRCSPYSEEQEGFDAETIRSAHCPSSVIVQEYGTRFKVRFDQHKTGFFCDQRENRFKLAQFCEGKSVLDLCCYTGGFAVQAKKLGNAAEVVGVELDEEPLKLARDNANMNQVRVTFAQSDVFPYMRDLIRDGRKFDVVVLDPPKLIRNRDEIEEGARKHFDLNRLAMQIVSPGGLLLTCSCAGLLSDDEFRKMLCSAARQAGDPIPTDDPLARPRHLPRDMQILASTGAGSDHPILGNCPESEYLKAYWLRML